jgi:hypothetical protein
MSMPQVRRALEIGRGTTTAFVAEEILSRQVSKYHYEAGYIGEGKLTTTPQEGGRVGGGYRDHQYGH